MCFRVGFPASQRQLTLLELQLSYSSMLSARRKRHKQAGKLKSQVSARFSIEFVHTIVRILSVYVSVTPRCLTARGQ